jgi:hypothetical protein
MAQMDSYNLANWKKYGISTSDAGRTLILKLAGTNLTHTNLEDVANYITTAHGVLTNGVNVGDSAFTIAGVGTADGSAFVSGTTDTVFFKIQGTGDITVATADMGIAGLTLTVEAIFTPAL